MATKKAVQKEVKPKIKGVKITVSNDQQTITRESVMMDTDDMVVIMPHYRVMTFKKRLYWFANILYRHWD
jgi:hypothetical protein